MPLDQTYGHFLYETDVDILGDAQATVAHLVVISVLEHDGIDLSLLKPASRAASMPAALDAIAYAGHFPKRSVFSESGDIDALDSGRLQQGSGLSSCDRWWSNQLSNPQPGFHARDRSRPCEPAVLRPILIFPTPSSTNAVATMRISSSVRIWARGRKTVSSFMQ